MECLKTVSRVVTAGGIALERSNAGGGVADAGGVAKERERSIGCVVETGGVV